MLIRSPMRCVVVGVILKFKTAGTTAAGVLVAVEVFAGAAVLAPTGTTSVALAVGGARDVAVLRSVGMLLGALISVAVATAVLLAVGFTPSVTTAVGPEGIRTGVGAGAQVASRKRSIRQKAIFITICTAYLALRNAQRKPFSNEL